MKPLFAIVALVLFSAACSHKASGMALYQQKKYDQAIPMLKAAMQENPEERVKLTEYYVDAVVRRSTELVIEGKPDQAVPLIDRALVVLPNEPRLVQQRERVMSVNLPTD